ncbi:hypothetical protein D3C72_1867560 [compost metagenome]
MQHGLAVAHPDGSPVRFFQEIRNVVGDQVYHLLRVSFASRQAGCGADGLFRPVGIATAQGGQRPDIGDCVINRFGFAGVLGGFCLRFAFGALGRLLVGRLFLGCGFLVGRLGKAAAQGNRCSSPQIRRRRHCRDMACI